MTCFEVATPEEKKQVLMQLVDDMTASAIDRSSQGYSQFLMYRNELISVIDKFMEEDRKRVEFAQIISLKIDEYFP